MNKVKVKGLHISLLIIITLVTTVYATDKNKIKSVSLSDSKIILNGVPIILKNSLISVVKENNDGVAEIYGSMEELFEKAGYIVTYDKENNIINLVSGSHNDSEKYELKVRDAPPVLKLEYTMDKNSYIKKVPHGHITWKYQKEDQKDDGTYTIIETDIEHPLNAVSIIPTIKISEEMKQLKVNFTFPPETYTVRRWSDEYANHAGKYHLNYEIIDISDDIIPAPYDGSGYIYEIQAAFPEGSASYPFYLKK